MTRGLTRQQIGVTDEMIASFGETVFKLSHNHQIRRGDPVREKNFEEIERQRAAMGLADVQIADRIGLSRDQVTFIRTLEERRRFRTGHYHRLLDLGGGKRFRDERFTPHLDRFAYGENALMLRSAMQFPPEQVRDYVEKGYWQNDTLRGWLEKWARETPDAPAISYAGQTTNYADLHEQVRRLAVGLMAHGVVKGDVVTVMLPNEPEYVVAYLAITYFGGVMSTLYLPHREREFDFILGHSNARAVICPSAIGDYSPAAVLVACKEKLPELAHVIAWGEAVDGTVALGDLLAHELPENDIEAPVASDPMVLMYTSGTTANPKAVPHNYHSLLSNARLTAPELQISAADTVMSAAPFGHLYACYAIHLQLAVGANSTLLPIFTPPDLARVIETEKPTVLLSAPAHMAACMGMGLFDSHDFSSLRVAVLSGSAVPASVALGVSEKLVDGSVCQLWGMTETQAALFTRPGDPPELAAATAGRATPGTDIRIADGDGNELPAGEEGELQVRGCLMFPGYFNNPAANEEAFLDDGFFRSGDLAVMDDKGNVAITGRIKEIIDRGGVKYNPRDVEDLIDRHPKVALSAILPMADEVLGERACVFVTAAGEEAPALADITQWLDEHGVSKVKWPERLVLVDEMPLTPTRKIIKGRLKLPQD